MILASLAHGDPSLDQIGFWPAYKVNEQGPAWYFQGRDGHLLRKKRQNTNIADFIKGSLTSTNQDNIHDGSTTRQPLSRQADILFLVARQTDHRQPRPSQLYPIKITKQPLRQLCPDSTLTSQQICRAHNIKPSNNSQITLYKITNPTRNQIWSLLWSQNVVLCTAPMSEAVRERLRVFCEAVRGRVQSRVLGEGRRVREFELVFTWDGVIGRARVLFAHNFRLVDGGTSDPGARDRNREMYVTNFKVGKDSYDRVQLLMQQKQLSVDQQTEDQFQLKRLRYLKLIQKQNQHNAPQTDQPTPSPKTISQNCTSCNNLVQINQSQSFKYVSMNRIPQIQLLRQVKMRRNLAGSYEMVVVCELCYEKFVDLVGARRQGPQARGVGDKGEQRLWTQNGEKDNEGKENEETSNFQTIQGQIRNQSRARRFISDIQQGQKKEQAKQPTISRVKLIADLPYLTHKPQQKLTTQQTTLSHATKSTRNHPLHCLKTRDSSAVDVGLNPRQLRTASVRSSLGSRVAEELRGKRRAGKSTTAAGNQAIEERLQEQSKAKLEPTVEINRYNSEKGKGRVDSVLLQALTEYEGYQRKSKVRPKLYRAY